MTSQCIHGFPPDQCASCRTCPHGQTTAACVRCRSSIVTRKPLAPAVAEPQQTHAGYEIFFEPAVSGWRYRGPDSAPSPLSYRSAFLARKAVDQVRANAEQKRSSRTSHQPAVEAVASIGE